MAIKLSKLAGAKKQKAAPIEAPAPAPEPVVSLPAGVSVTKASTSGKTLVTIRGVQGHKESKSYLSLMLGGQETWFLKTSCVSYKVDAIDPPAEAQVTVTRAFAARKKLLDYVVSIAA